MVRIYWLPFGLKGKGPLKSTLILSNAEVALTSFAEGAL